MSREHRSKKQSENRTDDSIFEFTFEILQASLASGRIIGDNPNSDPSSLGRPPNVEKFEMEEKIKKYDASIGSMVRQDLRQSCRNRLEEVKRLRHLTLTKCALNIDTQDRSASAVTHSQARARSACYRQEIAAKRRLQLQVETAERRMRELVFEILGEYGKSNVRLRRRQEYIKFTNRIYIAWIVWKTQWERFALRLCFESCRNLDVESKSSQCDQLKSRVLCCVDDSSEIQAVDTKVRRRLASSISPDSKIITVVKITKSSNSGAGGSGGDGTRAGPVVVATTLSDVAGFSDILRAWVTKSNVLVPNSSSKTNLSPPKSSTKASDTTTCDNGSTSAASTTSASATALKNKEADIKLKEFLSSSVVEWLHPASYYPSHWDTLVPHLQSISSNRKSHSGKRSKFTSLSSSSSNASKRMQDNSDKVSTSIDPSASHGLDDFILRYSSQHTACVASQRLYFCLEERNFAASEGVFLASSTQDPTVETLSALQSIYCKKSKESSAPLSSLTDLRSSLSNEPYAAVDILGGHRSSTSKSHNGLKAFPDIIRATSTSGNDLHFAPATVLNVVETETFKHIGANSDQLRAAATRCPHPLLPLLMSPSSSSPAPLDRLFCLVRVTPISMTPTEKTRTDSDNHNNNDTDNQDSELDTTTNKRGDGKHRGESTGISNAGKRQQKALGNGHSLLLLMPLSHVCMKELVREYLWPRDVKDTTAVIDIRPPTPTSITPVTPRRTSISAAAGDFFSNAPTFMHLLPDHARCRVTDNPRPTTSSTSQSQSHSHASSSSSSSPTLYHKYVLMEDSNETPTPSKANGDNEASPSKSETQARRKIHFYLIQIDNSAGIEVNSSSAVSQVDASTSNGDTWATKSAQNGHNGHTENVSLHDRDHSLLKTALQFRSSHNLGTSSSTTKSNKKSSNRAAEKDQGADSVSGADSSNYNNNARDNRKDDDDEGGASGGGNPTKSKWDNAILSTVCRWRSCLCEAATDCTSPATRYLCHYHANLKTFLDDKALDTKTTSEASKFLPKRAPNVSAIASDVKKDLVVIRAASTLLQELWDGKLKATMRSFTKKILQDLNTRRRLESALSMYAATVQYLSQPPASNLTSANTGANKKGSKDAPTKDGGGGVVKAPLLSLPPPPDWISWKNEAHFRATLDAISSSGDILANILEVERAVSDELRALVEFRVYPSVELALVRKEMKAFKDYQEEQAMHQQHQQLAQAQASKGSSGSSSSVHSRNLALTYQLLTNTSVTEQKVCEKKLSIIRARRQDEQEARAAYLRKQAKMKEREVKDFTFK